MCLASALRLGGQLLSTGAAEREAESTRWDSMARECARAMLSPLCCAICIASVSARVASCSAAVQPMDKLHITCLSFQARRSR